MADLVERRGAGVDLVDEPIAAFERARSLATEDDAIIVVGSAYVVGPVRTALRIENVL
jgi:hypothetical protein